MSCLPFNTRAKCNIRHTGVKKYSLNDLYKHCSLNKYAFSILVLLVCKRHRYSHVTQEVVFMLREHREVQRETNTVSKGQDIKEHWKTIYHHSDIKVAPVTHKQLQ